MPKNLVQGVRVCAPDQLASPGTGVVISVSAAGNVRLVMADNSRLDVYAGVGTAELDGYAVKGFLSAGTTATVNSVSVY